MAANLTNVAVDQIERGDVVCQRGIYAPTACFDATIRLLPSVREPLRHWQRVHLCIGTSEVLARVALLQSKQIRPGTEEPAQLVLEEPVVCTLNQRFIIRFYSPLITIGGGGVVFPYSRKPRGAEARARVLARMRALLSAGTPSVRLGRLIDDAKAMDAQSAAVAMQETLANCADIARNLAGAGKIVELKGDKPLYLSLARCAAVS